MSIAQSLLPELDMEMAGTRKVLERIPADKFEFRPHEKSFKMIALATHIANMLGWGRDTIKTDSFDVAPVGGEPYKEDPAASVAELLGKFDKNLAGFREALAGASDADLMANWSLLSGGQTLFTMPRIACLRGMILNHLIHHRAQLTVYLRMCDVPVPALYGPSADESGM
ncbi:MAG TPA: DinB family protein [Blastocatellia bacterium]|nr:DinB family protein [Blastocatellia bacterium]